MRASSSPAERAGHAMFDLAGYVVERCERAGDRRRSRTSAIALMRTPRRFYSYRRATHRAEPDYGRHINAIALAEGHRRSRSHCCQFAPAHSARTLASEKILRDNETGRIARPRSRLVITAFFTGRRQTTGRSWTLGGSHGGEKWSDEARRRQLQSPACRGDRRLSRDAAGAGARCGASPTWRYSSKSRKTSAAPTSSSSSRRRSRPTTT